MSQKLVDIPDIGPVILQRRKGTRSMRLTVRPDGTLRVGMPTWTPYKTAVAFVRAQRGWLEKHRIEPSQSVLLPDMRIGKYHQLVFNESPQATRTTTRLVGREARVTHPVGRLYKDSEVQKAAERIVVKALTKEASALLPQQLQKLAQKHGFQYRSVSIKRLQSRWGSCSNQKDIVLNCYLMQLPWDLIDYVLLHELNHTNIMRHGEPFWSALAQYVPNLPEVRKRMRAHSPTALPVVR